MVARVVWKQETGNCCNSAETVHFESICGSWIIRNGTLFLASKNIARILNDRREHEIFRIYRNLGFLFFFSLSLSTRFMKFSGETFYSPSFHQGYISDSLELHLLVTRLERLRYFTILDSVYTTGFFPFPSLPLLPTAVITFMLLYFFRAHDESKFLWKNLLTLRNLYRCQTHV